MINLDATQQKYSDFINEAKKIPEIQNCIDQQFQECIQAGRLGCQTPRDILPFCGRILKVTQLAYNNRIENPNLLISGQNCLKTFLV